MAKKKAETTVAAPRELVDIPVGQLHHDPANVRKHNVRNLATIKASLARFGQQKPIVVDQDNIVRAGNGTLEAARELGWATLSCIRSHLTGSEATAYAIADNRSAELAEWDDEGLAETLRALQSEDFDLASVGFDAGEVDALIEGLASSVPEGEWANAIGDLPDGDKSPFQSMTFTLSNDQAEVVKRAIEAAKDAGPFADTGNENSNGNALARICEAYV